MRSRRVAIGVLAAALAVPCCSDAAGRREAAGSTDARPAEAGRSDAQEAPGAGTGQPSPWSIAAMKVVEATVQDLEKRFAGLSGDRWKGVEPVLVEPFVVFVQRDASWDPAAVARHRGGELQRLAAILFRDFGGALGFKPIDFPVPVVYLRNWSIYRQYCGDRGNLAGSLLHFERRGGRLVLHDGCTHEGVFWGGTNQLLWAWSRGLRLPESNPDPRLAWFREGIAEWYGSVHREIAGGDRSSYAVGVLRLDRIEAIARRLAEGRSRELFTLQQLVSATLSDRDGFEESSRIGVFVSQSWFFVYFLNHFNVDAEGFVHPERPGTYRDRWIEFVKHELTAPTGLDGFMKIMGLSEKDLDDLDTEFWRYLSFVRRKVNYRHEKDRVLIPWDLYVNKRGQKSGEQADDRLPAFDPLQAAPKGK